MELPPSVPELRQWERTRLMRVILVTHDAAFLDQMAIHATQWLRKDNRDLIPGLTSTFLTLVTTRDTIPAEEMGTLPERPPEHSAAGSRGEAGRWGDHKLYAVAVALLASQTARDFVLKHTTVPAERKRTEWFLAWLERHVQLFHRWQTPTGGFSEAYRERAYCYVTQLASAMRAAYVMGLMHPVEPQTQCVLPVNK